MPCEECREQLTPLCVYFNPSEVLVDVGSGNGVQCVKQTVLTSMGVLRNLPAPVIEKLFERISKNEKWTTLSDYNGVSPVALLKWLHENRINHTYRDTAAMINTSRKYPESKYTVNIAGHAGHAWVVERKDYTNQDHWETAQDCDCLPCLRRMSLKLYEKYTNYLVSGEQVTLTGYSGLNIIKRENYKFSMIIPQGDRDYIQSTIYKENDQQHCMTSACAGNSLKYTPTDTTRIVMLDTNKYLNPCEVKKRYQCSFIILGLWQEFHGNCIHNKVNAVTSRLATTHH